MRLDSEPQADFPGRLEHAAECASCAQYAARAAVFERRLAAAIEVEAPALEFEFPAEGESESASVVPLRPETASTRRRDWRLPAWAGVAASLVLGVALVLQFGDRGIQDISPQTLAHEVLAHMDHEPYSRVVSSSPVAEDRLAQVLRPAVSRLDSERVGLVTYARTCPINGRDVPHLVVQGVDGPVTLLLMPEEKLRTPVALDGDAFHGVILPVGDGSIAVIGEKGHSVDDVTDSIRRAVDWSI